MKKSLALSTLYNNALISFISEFKEKELTRECYKKIAFLGVKTIVSCPKKDNITYNEALTIFKTISFIKNIMSNLTVKEFVNIFPIQKVYDGKKWECKDYFYTKDYLKGFAENEVIGEKIDELMWEYVNINIRDFNISYLMSIDYLRRFEGEKSMMEEWADMNGIDTYLLKKDDKGKEFIYDKKNQRTLKVKKVKPKYLKIIK